MKPPVKVYVTENEIGTGYTLDVSYVPEPPYDEYIRKDALLEYLDKWMAKAVRWMQVGASAYHQGKVALITDIQDWLNREEEK